MTPLRQEEITKNIRECADQIVWKNNCNPAGLDDALNYAINGFDGGPEFTLGLALKIFDRENFETFDYVVKRNWITLSVIFALLFNRDNCIRWIQIDGEKVRNPRLKYFYNEEHYQKFHKKLPWFI